MNEKSTIDHSSSLRRVVEVRTSRLFGLYDHKVRLHLGDRVTIIHGPNGVGKTILLRLLHALFAQRFFELLTIPFESLSVDLDSGESITVVQRFTPAISEKGDNSPSSPELTFTILNTNGTSELIEINDEHLNFDSWASQFEENTAWLIEVDERRWIDRRTDRIYSSYELWKAFGNGHHPNTSADHSIPSRLSLFLKRVSTFLVEAQRLVILSPTRSGSSRLERQFPHFRAAVLDYASELRDRIKDSATTYGSLAQRLDQSFPQRLFQRQYPSLSREAIKAAIQDLEKQRARLKTLGILDESVANPFDTSSLDQSDNSQVALMSLYVKDNIEKLNVLNDLARRIEPLINSINDKFKNKSVHVSRDKGLVAYGSDGKEIDLDYLSSGEQHELVLLFNLLFKIRPNTLVMIDEPELSLHIEWQRKFLPELLSITATAKIDALVATHSSPIIGERDDLMIDLLATADQ